MKHKYFRAYLGFLALEIPSLLQIITLLTLISLVSNYLILKIIIIYLVYKLTNIYLNEKLLIFINNELRYYSDIKKDKDELLRSLIVHNRAASLTSSLIMGGIIGLVIPSELTMSITEQIRKFLLGIQHFF